MVRSMNDVVADIVTSMRRKHAREDESSESDDGVAITTNRGNKLKRSARYVQEGTLSNPEGPLLHPQKITHATFNRKIVYRNPKRFDEEGIELSGSESDEDADAVMADENPYRDIHIDRILEPIMRASDLPSNPNFSAPYTSPVLTNMVKEAEKQLQAARTALWKAKNLLTDFRGDEMWIPTGAVELEEDFEIFHPKSLKLDAESSSKSKPKHHDVHSTEHDGPRVYMNLENNIEGVDDHDHIAPEASSNGQLDVDDVQMVDAPTNGLSNPKPMGEGVMGESAASGEVEHAHEADKAVKDVQEKDEPDTGDAMNSEQSNGMKPADESPQDQDTDPLNKALAKDNDTITGDFVALEGSLGDPEDETTPPPPPRRMTTRAQAQAASTSLENSNSSSRTRSQSPATSTLSSNYIDPLYLLPPSAMPDRDFGLPTNEAEETRRLLMTYIQKQEEVVRGHEKIFEGLARADRWRMMVLEWCKADGHTGELSDGEDWYDKEFWGLDEDLRKGQDDEEEIEAAGGGDKGKRRGRRA